MGRLSILLTGRGAVVLATVFAVVPAARADASGAVAKAHRGFAAVRTSAAAAPFEPGFVIFAYRPGVPVAARRAIERSVGGRGVRHLGPPVAPPPGSQAAHAPLAEPLLLRVAPGEVRHVVALLRRRREVAYAEPDYLMRASATPNDASFGLQWSDSNTGQAVPAQGPNESTGPPAKGTPAADDRGLAAWGITTGDPSIVIGEVDSGVDYDHPDLEANVWTNPGGVLGCPAGSRGYNVLNRTCNPVDEDGAYGGHGTHVAGIMGAVGNNALGVAGMNWRTTILPVRWLNSASSGQTSGLIEALRWLVAAKQAGVNVRVVNDSATFAGEAYSQALAEQIHLLGANQILFVTAAGNTEQNNDEVARYPCDYRDAAELCVTATDNNDRRPSWADWGPHTVDLGAPGVSIFSTLRDDSFGYLTGGSMAAAQVSGAAALILAAAPCLPLSALRGDILEGVDRLPSMMGRTITGGRLDVLSSMQLALAQPCSAPEPPPPPPPPSEAPAGGVLGTTSVRGTIAGMTIFPQAFVAARHGPTIARRGGAVLSYTDSEPSVTQFTIRTTELGVRDARGRCVRPRGSTPRAFPRSSRCTRYPLIGSFSRRDRIGRNSFHFSGRVAGHTLAPRSYRLRALPTFAGQTGTSASARFRVMR
jgi:subtilisin family serine protease